MLAFSSCLQKQTIRESFYLLHYIFGIILSEFFENQSMFMVVLKISTKFREYFDKTLRYKVL